MLFADASRLRALFIFAPLFAACLPVTADAQTPAAPTVPPTQTAVGASTAQATPPLSVPAAASRVTVRSVVVEGAGILAPEFVARNVASVIVGKPATRENLRAVSAAIRKLYQSRNYPLAQVVGVDLDETTGVLRVSIVEGRIVRILVKGNRHTRTKTILSALSVRSGDIYDAKRVQNDRNRLDRLGIFSEVSITTQLPGTLDETPPAPSTTPPASSPAPSVQKGTASPSAGASGTVPNAPPAAVGASTAQADPQTVPPAPVLPTFADVPEDEVGQVEIVVRVKERQTINVAATVGYSDGAGAVGFADVSEANLAGLAQRASIQWQRTTRGIVQPDGSITDRDSRAAFNASYDVPALGVDSFGFGVDVYQKNTVFLPFFSGDQNSIRSYERRRGATVRGVRTIGESLSALVTYRNDRVGYDSIPFDLNPPYDELAQADATVGALGLGLVSDGRDRADNPRRGFLRSVTFEQAGSGFGGNRNFNQTTLDLRQYVPLALNPLPGLDNSDAASRTPVLAVRLLGGVSTGDVPLSEQYFLGGYELLRGYDLFSIRGTRMVLGTGELRLPLGGGTQAVVFADGGNAWGGRDSRADFPGVKASVGAGLRFLSPIGPIRFDAAYGSRLRTYITLGQSF